MLIGVVGDVHLAWGNRDLEDLRVCSYDVVLFVGDLGGYRHHQTLRVCRAVADLPNRALMIPGNHDGPSLGALAGEVYGRRRLVRAFSGGQSDRVDQLRSALGSVEVVGYSRHLLEDDLELIAARPHSMGGPTPAFAPFLKRRFGVETMRDSAARLRRLVDESKASRLVFLGHNGPTGLGDRRDDPWGCDFRAQEGDQGDPDLRDAIDYAVASGRRVVAVVAGHMHHRLRGGGLRRWQLSRDGVLYVNAARVPRVFRRGGRELRHHVAVEITGSSATAREVLSG